MTVLTVYTSICGHLTSPPEPDEPDESAYARWSASWEAAVLAHHACCCQERQRREQQTLRPQPLERCLVGRPDCPHTARVALNNELGGYAPSNSRDAIERKETSR